jgi:type IV pilus assembly protein PilC
MRFHYIASNSDGKIIEDNYEANNPAEVLVYLGTRGLKPISLKVVKDINGVKQRHLWGQSITLKDKIFLTKYLSLMLSLGTDLLRAIDILITDFNKPAMKVFLGEVKSGLEKGQPFYTVFAKYLYYFSPVFVYLIKAGETSGNLEAVLNNLSVSLQREQELRQKIKTALTYPLIVLIAAIIMVFFLTSFTLPRIADVFLKSGITPPLFSQVVFSIGLFLGKYLWLFIAWILIIGFLVWYFSVKTLSGRKIARQLILKIPFLGDILKKIALQRFVFTFGLLLKSGLLLNEALEITADAVGSEEIKASLLRISKEGIAKGLTIGEAFRREVVFPRVIADFLAISEKAGHIESVLETLDHFYELEIDEALKTFITFLEPAMLLFIGGIIGLIALSIILPIYQLVANF